MKIAILGAGFSGLSTCWHLLNHPHFASCKITLFDPIEISRGTSGLSSGLLHSYGGAQARKSWMASEGMSATKELLFIASQAIRHPVATYAGILRPIITDKQHIDFSEALSKHQSTQDPEGSDLQWWTKDYCSEQVTGIVAQAGLFISSGITVQSDLYLKGLWQACQNLGASLEQQRISTLEELYEFNLVIVATGYASKDILELAHLPLSLVKGQIIELQWPDFYPPSPYDLVSNGYIVMQPKTHSCLVGSTYEKGFIDSKPDPRFAAAELKPKVSKYLPFLSEAPLLSCRAGIRAISPDNLTPIVGKIPEGRYPPTWIMTALGSKGLLYHALFGKLLVKAIAADDPALLPHKARHRLT